MPEDLLEEAERFAAPQQLIEIVDLLQRVATAAPNTIAMRNVTGRIRVWIFTMQTNSVHEGDVDATNVIPPLQHFLSDANRPQRQAKRIPWDIYEDLLVILRKWELNDFGVRPHRGFIRNPRGRWVPYPDWQFRRDARFFGHGHLVNGQRFASRYQLWNEGGHAAVVAGIAGTERDGAYSVVMGLHSPASKLVYADVDCGEVIYYMSTALPGEEGELPTNVRDHDDEDLDVDAAEATRGAKALMRSHETGTPVRVFRSWKASKKVPDRPNKGFRYDGLYKVVDYECLQNRRQIYRFKMIRLRDGQGPIRGVRQQRRDTPDKATKRRTEDQQRRDDGGAKRRRTK